MAFDSFDQSYVGPRLTGLQSRTATASAPWLLKLIVVANFLPSETSLMLGGLRLPAARLLLLLAAPYLLIQLVQKIDAGYYRFVMSDLLVLLTGCWMIFGSASAIGLGDALNHAGPEMLEFCFGYLAARTLLNQSGQARDLVNLLCIATAIVGLLAVLDSLTDRFVLHDFASSLFGGTEVVPRPDYRLGMRRACGSLEHPILLGTACMIALLFARALPLRGRLFVFAGCTVGLVVSVSAAPMQATVIGFALLSYGRLFAWFRWRWHLLNTLVIGFVVLSFVGAGSPLGFVNQHLIFDPASGYSREFEWETVGHYVLSSPWVGIGFGWDAIAEQTGAFASIDSLWLGKALIYGIPCSVLIALSLLGSTWLPTSGPDAHLEPLDARLGTVLGIIMCLFMFLGFTVYFWGSMWILCAVLAGIRAHLGELAKLST